MNTTQLTDFYALTAKSDREMQKQADCFIVQAMNLALEGDAIMSGEMLLKAHQIITETLERDNEYKRTTNEMEAFVGDLTLLNRGAGGFFD